MILEKILAAYGECQVAKNGHEALQAFNQAFVDKQPFDLICLDLGLPDFEGSEVLTKMRAVEDMRGIPQGQRVHIIAITAASDADTVKTVTGMSDGYILKPINRERLIQDLVRLGLISPESPPGTTAPAP